MYSKIIVPISMDQLDHGEKALKRAVTLLDAGGELVLLNAIEDLNAYAQGYMIVDFPLELIESSREQAHKSLTEMIARLGITARVETRMGGAASVINAFAEDEKADLVIIAAHRPGLIDYFIGSTASRVTSHCKCSVLVDR